MKDEPIVILISPRAHDRLIDILISHVNGLPLPIGEEAPEKKVDTGDFRIDLLLLPDIMCDTEDDKSREHYKKVTAPPPPWKKGE